MIGEVAVRRALGGGGGVEARKGLPPPPHTLKPVPEPPFRTALTPYPLSPAVLIGMEGRGGTLGWGRASRGFAGRGSGCGGLIGGSQAVA